MHKQRWVWGSRSGWFGTQSSCLIFVPFSWMAPGGCGCQHLVFPRSLSAGRKRERLGLGFQDEAEGAGGVLSFCFQLLWASMIIPPVLRGRTGCSQPSPGPALFTLAARFHSWLCLQPGEGQCLQWEFTPCLALVWV